MIAVDGAVVIGQPRFGGIMACCEICRKESNKLYWWSQYPTVYLCKDCWGRIDDYQEHLIRITIARRLKAVRQEGARGRLNAFRLLRSLEGTGVPARRRWKNPQTGGAL